MRASLEKGLVVNSVHVTSHTSSFGWMHSLTLKILKDSLPVDKLLSHETGSGKHSKTSVLKFLRLESDQFFRVRRLEAERVESEVTRDVVVTEKTGFVNRGIGGIHPADHGTGLFGSTDSNSEEDPEGGRDLRKVGDGRARDRSIEEERRTFYRLADKESNDSKHGNTSVGELSFTVSLQSGGIGLVSESKRVEESDRRNGSN